jgi:hypothetical protein
VLHVSYRNDAFDRINLVKAFTVFTDLVIATQSIAQKWTTDEDEELKDAVGSIPVKFWLRLQR